jgi:hypothetical protein
VRSPALHEVPSKQRRCEQKGDQRRVSSPAKIVVLRKGIRPTLGCSIIKVRRASAVCESEGPDGRRNHRRQGH